MSAPVTLSAHWCMHTEGYPLEALKIMPTLEPIRESPERMKGGPILVEQHV